MPYIAVHLVADHGLTELQTQQLVSGITDIMERTLRKKRHLVAVSISLSEPNQWFIAGKQLKSQSAFIQAFLTAATNTDQEKAQAIQELHVLVQKILQSVEEASYIVLNTIPATDWGYAGKTQASRYASARTQEQYAYHVQHAHTLRNAVIKNYFLIGIKKLTDFLDSVYKAAFRLENR